MGYNQILVVALLLLSPLAYGQLLNNGIIGGQICCASSGNCPPGAVGIPGVPVRVNCTNFITNVQSFTGPTGTFNIPLLNVLSSAGPLLNRLPPCAVSVNLPLNSTVCPILSTVNGTLAGVPRLVGTILDPVLGLVSNLSVPVFTNVTVG